MSRRPISFSRGTTGAKPSLSRRRLLRGIGGAALALPFLETFAPKRAKAGGGGTTPKYAIFVRQGNGVQQGTEDEPDRYWPDQDFGALTTASMSSDPDRALATLAPHAGKICIPRGLHFAFDGNGCGHSGGGNQVLTAAKVSADPSGADSLSMGESIDNIIARKLGADGATEPLTLYVGRKFNYLDEVLSYTAATNHRSQAVMRKLGLQREETLDFTAAYDGHSWSGLVWVARPDHFRP